MNAIGKLWGGVGLTHSAQESGLNVKGSPPAPQHSLPTTVPSPSLQNTTMDLFTFMPFFIALSCTSIDSAWHTAAA